MSLSNTATLDHNTAPTTEIRQHRADLLAIAEEMVAAAKRESTPIEARVKGNVRPGIMVKFDPRTTIILKIIRVAEDHDLRIADAYQLDRDTEDGIMRLSFKDGRIH